MAFRPKHWFLQLFIACDQLANVLITPLQSSAWADESMSSRCCRAWRDGKIAGRIFMPIIDFMFLWQTEEHCRNAYIKECARYNSPPEMRIVK